MKIVITGGLGYIGTELCKLYSGETRYKKIVVTDNRFVSERVKQLRDWGIDFINISILNEEMMKEILKDADVVYHLAGITDVAYVKTQEDKEKDDLIRKTGIEGTRNILNFIPNSCKIIFPSTHVLYEGLKETKFNITEDESPCPVLTYASVKFQNEIDIKNSGKNYVILRLASVYGYSHDTMRIGIMPNLFSKMASQNSKISLFAGGIQYKSLVNVIDVARVLKFMAESDIKNETFHVSNEHKTVKEVAELCKKYNPSIELVNTNDEIPNLGYTISNAKLLSTGFKFLYNLEDSIKEMITKWSVRTNINPELEFIIKGEKEYVDERGIISNYELTEPINLIGYITSKAGTVRANHYHPIQEQKCLLIKGKYVSVIKDLLDTTDVLKTRIIKEGDIAVIKPNVAHAMIFLEDSIFLNLVNGEREHKNYGITHTIPYKLVDEEFKKNIINNYQTKCRCCGGENLLPVIYLGLSPLANNLLESTKDKDELYPLEMVYCSDCYNCQLSYVVPPEKMFNHYLYVSSTTKSFREHFENASKKYIDEFNLDSNSFVIDIGSNDGIALKPMKEKGIKVLGIEPASNIAKMANDAGIETINEYFNSKVANHIENNFGKADLITASNVFAHSDHLKEMAISALSLLKESGVFIIEVQYLVDTIKDLTFDNIYHEHVNYWSVTSIVNFFNNLSTSKEWRVNRVEHINTHGGSIRIFVSNTKNKIDDSVALFLEKEKEFGINRYDTYFNFAKRIITAKNNVIKNIKKYKEQGLTLVGYGSPAKATTALNYYGITSKEIDYIIEDNPLKHNKILPGCRIPIYSKNKLNEKLPDIIIVMAWNFFDEIKRNNQELIDKGIKFINIKDLQND